MQPGLGYLQGSNDNIHNSSGQFLVHRNSGSRAPTRGKIESNIVGGFENASMNSSEAETSQDLHALNLKSVE